jgi:hypothetical protein
LGAKIRSQAFHLCLDEPIQLAPYLCEPSDISVNLFFFGFVAEACSCPRASIISSRDLSQLMALLCSALLGVRCRPPAIMRLSRLNIRAVQLNSSSINESLVLVGV